MRGWEDWKLLFVVPLTLALVTIIVLAFEANPSAAAAFFGSFAAASATVIAVLLGGSITRRNELRRERRQHVAETRVIAVELNTRLRMAIADTHMVASDLNSQINERWRAQLSRRPFQETPNLNWLLVIERACPPTPERIVEKLGRFDAPVVTNTLGYIRLAKVIRENLSRRDIYPPTEPMDENHMRSNISLLEQLNRLATDASTHLLAHLDSVSHDE